MITASRSSIQPENLQEHLDADAAATSGFGQQYFTPSFYVEQCVARMATAGITNPATVLDMQAGEGALLEIGERWRTKRFAIDIDNRLKPSSGAHLLTGNCVKAMEILDDLHPGTVFDCINVNPPFGRKFKLPDGSTIDSTEWTWKQCLKHGNSGFFISNANTIEKLGIDKHPFVFHYEVTPGLKLWKGVRDTLKIGTVFWKNPTPPEPTYHWDIKEAFDNVRRVLDDEKAARPNFNIFLDHAGNLRTYLSVRSELKLKLDSSQITRLHSINEAHPLTLTTEKETRTLMQSLVDCGIYTIQPEAKAAMEGALKAVASLACPIMPCTPFESVAYAEEEEALTAVNTCVVDGISLTAGKSYPISTGTYKFTDKFTRNKVHYDEKTMTTYTKEHDCTLSGTDRYIQLSDDNEHIHRFMDRPAKGSDWQHDEKLLWELFNRPKVNTIAEAKPGEMDRNAAILKSLGMVAGFEYYPGQAAYLARVAAKDSGLVAAETGTGKTLMALSLLAIKSPERALIIAPQGTMRSSEDTGDDEDEDSTEFNASQWIQEIHRFTPYLQVWELFSYADYERICALNGGKLPPGVYVSYYEAMFSNGARETVPETWDDKKLNTWAKANGLAELPAAPKSEDEDEDNDRYWCSRVGMEVDGVRSIIAPCLATQIGHLFDMVLLDEAHYCTNLSATRTAMLLRLQPQYRWALTATPIPNIVSNLFSLMGWIAVAQWFKGGRRNAAWPYAREEIGRFNSTFLTTERDHTAEDMKAAAARAAGEFWRGKCEKDSPVISSPARLLKLLKPSMAFISKEDCNPAYIKPEVIDVRVPMGKEQAVLYGHFLNRGNVPGGHPLIRARRQTAWLRNICADPAGFTHGGPRVSSNLNPKVIATLELVRDLLPTGQVLIISSRIGLTNTLQHRLTEAGIPIARIDSTLTPDQHAYQANLFKQGRASVLLMGLKCAASYSFDQCPYEIITSLEYSYGPFEQARGRIDRLTNKVKKKIFCILHKGSLEEVMYDVVATKGDAATICLRGQRVPREFKPVDAGEVLAAAIERFDLTGSTPESDCEKQWPKLSDALRKSLFDTTT